MNTAAPVTRGEVLGVLILSLGFGLVGIDRFLISTTYPTIARDRHFEYADIGTITGALANELLDLSLELHDVGLLQPQRRAVRRQFGVASFLLPKLTVGPPAIEHLPRQAAPDTTQPSGPGLDWRLWWHDATDPRPDAAPSAAIDPC